MNTTILIGSEFSPLELSQISSLLCSPPSPYFVGDIEDRGRVCAISLFMLDAIGGLVTMSDAQEIFALRVEDFEEEVMRRGASATQSVCARLMAVYRSAVMDAQRHNLRREIDEVFTG